MKLKPIMILALLLTSTLSFMSRISVKLHANITSCEECVMGLWDTFAEYQTIINVSDYDGESDREQIQKALDDVPPEGAIVFIPAGIWQAYNLTARSRTILTGTDNSILRRPVNITLPFLTFQNQSEFAVVDLVFEGQSTPQAVGILVSDCTKFQFLNNTFRQISRNAVRVTGRCNQFNILGNRFSHCNDASIILFGSPGERRIKDFVVINNLLTDGADNGKIGVAFAANGTISNNTLLRCEHGIATRCVSNITVKYNYIEDCSGYALYLGTQPADPGSDNIKIMYNQAVNCNIGISRWYGSQPIRNVTLTGNHLVHSMGWDIHADFPATFVDNTLTSNSKLKLLNAALEFVGTLDVEGLPIMPGDINHDLKIDMKDIGVTARLFGSTPSSDSWDPSVDTIQDGIIDMQDVSFLAKQFGSEWPGG